MASIDYIHDNPVKRRLVKIATKWKWSSARWYVSEGKQIDAELPQLHFPSAELFYSGT
jgi:putative transposase